MARRTNGNANKVAQPNGARVDPAGLLRHEEHRQHDKRKDQHLVNDHEPDADV